MGNILSYERRIFVQLIKFFGLNLLLLAAFIGYYFQDGVGINYCDWLKNLRVNRCYIVDILKYIKIQWVVRVY